LISRARWLSIGTAGLALALGALGPGGCGRHSGPDVDRDTRAAARAVDRKAGSTFLDYYAEVLRLAQRYNAQPDSFRIALDALPGSHLTDGEWKAWTAPYARDPEPLAQRIEKVIADLGAPH
jgi:hypothetical protein